MNPSASSPLSFPRVLNDELKDIERRRDDTPPAAPPPPPAAPAAEPNWDEVRQKAQGMDLTGLAFSGGGIRSATLCLGFLQGLADFGLLKRFDYLSTVSGGGYIGSWLTAWIKREGSVHQVEKQLRDKRADQAEGRVNAPKPTEEEPEPIFHLRAYSNYLSPHVGLLTADSWVLLAIYLRNFLLNQLMLLPAITALLLLPRLLMVFYDWKSDETPVTRDLWFTVAFALAAGPGAWLLLSMYHKWQAPQAPAVRLWYFAFFVVSVVFLFWLVAGLLLGVWDLGPGDKPPDWAFWFLFFGGLALGFLLWGTFWIVRGVLRLQRERQGRVDTTQEDLQERVRNLHHRILLPLLIAAVLACWFGWESPDPYLWNWPRLVLGLPGVAEGGLAEAGYPSWVRGAFLFGAAGSLIFGLIHAVFAYLVPSPPGQNPLGRWAGWVAAGLLGGFVGGACVGVLLFWFSKYVQEGSLADQASEVATVLTFGPPALLSAFILGGFGQVGLLGRQLEEYAREWWASLCGWVLIYAAGWLAVGAVALYAMPVLLWVGPTAQALLGASWVGTAVAGLVAAHSPKTGNSKTSLAADRLAQAAPYVFVVGLLVAVSALLHAVVDDAPDMKYVEQVQYLKPLRDPEPRRAPTTVTETDGVEARTREYTETRDEVTLLWRRYWAGVLNTHEDIRDPVQLAVNEYDAGRLLTKLTCWLSGCVALALLTSWRVGVNVFSLHAVYGNRLIRCYLGASRPKGDTTDQLHGAPANVGPPPRRPNPLTGFDANDDFPLHDLVVGAPAAVAPATPARARPYRGPYLLVNTALNLTQGDELAWQERKAEAFLLSPRYAGSKSTGYRPLAEAGGFGGGLTLGTAMTLSGAAASPNMGYHSSPAVTALMTVFNVRLGGWLGNPNGAKWEANEPQMALFQLLKELFGRTNRKSGYVYLSDGGHFENLGVYELVRRRCRYVVVVDGGADPDFVFDDLGGLVRKCRSDLGVPIEIDTTPVKPQGEGRFARWHCAVGAIRYDHLDKSAAPGLLLYVKASLTGDEPSDVLNYAALNPAFPHQTTADQFFSESQFESHRALGRHIAREVFWDALRDVGVPGEMSDAAHRRVVNRLFTQLRRRWYPPPPQLEASYLESVKACVELEGALREDEDLVRFVHSLYPELGAQPVPATDAQKAAWERAELLSVNQMLQVMESAWLGVSLEGHHAHPLNRGWMNAFRRWSSSDVFRRNWPLLRGEYTQDFVRFCEGELKLDRGRPRLVKRDLADPGQSAPWDQVHREFAREWPGVDLDALLGRAATPVWLLTLATAAGATIPCGFLVAHEEADAHELLVWVRGAYRNLRLGRLCLDGPADGDTGGLAKVKAALAQAGGPQLLRVRFPGAAAPGSGTKLQKEMWLSFFHQYGFVQDGTSSGKDLVLQCTRDGLRVG